MKITISVSYYREVTERTEKKALVKFLRGVLFIIEVENYTGTTTEHPSRNINLEIAPSFFKDYNLTHEDFAEGLNSAEAKFTLLKVFNECRQIDEQSPLYVHFLLLQLLSKRKNTDPYSNWARQLKDLLHDEWNQEHTLKSLSARLGVHPVTISKNFSRHFNYNLGDYLRRLRIEKAVELICKTDLSLTQIAHHCGFYDQSHFIRIFQNQIGISPKVLRKL